MTASEIAELLANFSFATPFTLIKICGKRVITDASSAKDFLLRATSCAMASAVKSPSPVLAYLRIMTWPDCSPPKTKSLSSMRSRT